MLRHLYDRDGNILLSGEVDDGLTDDRVACALLSEFRTAMRRGDGRSCVERLHIRDAVFEDFIFDGMEFRDCMFDDIDFARCSSSTTWVIQGGRVEHCRFAGNLKSMSWNNCDISDVDLLAADISGRIEHSRLRAVQMRLNDKGEIPVSLFQSTLQAVVFGAEVPDVPKLYSRVYAEILKGRDRAPAHIFPWLYHILEAVLGPVWTDMTERHGFATARDLLFYYNSADTELFQYGRDGKHMVEIIRGRAEAEGFAA